MALTLRITFADNATENVPVKDGADLCQAVEEAFAIRHRSGPDDARVYTAALHVAVIDDDAAAAAREENERRLREAGLVRSRALHRGPSTSRGRRVRF